MILGICQIIFKVLIVVHRRHSIESSISVVQMYVDPEDNLLVALDGASAVGQGCVWFQFVKKARVVNEDGA